MQKMGWKPGEGLGKERDGNLEPLMLDVKSDRKGKGGLHSCLLCLLLLAGLVAIEEMPSSIRKPVSSTFGSDMTGKWFNFFGQ